MRCAAQTIYGNAVEGSQKHRKAPMPNQIWTAVHRSLAKIENSRFLSAAMLRLYGVSVRVPGASADTLCAGGGWAE